MTPNIIGKVNRELKQNNRIVSAFPSEDLLICLQGTILMDVNKE